jgi:hypothetical protein
MLRGGINTTEEYEEDKKPLIMRTYDYFLKHPAIGGSFIYIICSIVGVIYSWFLYNKFQINIFDYAETNDFLLIAFKEPFSYLLALGVFVISSILMAIIFYFFLKKLRMCILKLFSPHSI